MNKVVWLIKIIFWTMVSMIAGILLAKYLSLKIMAYIVGGIFLFLLGVSAGKTVGSSKGE